jgi:hypothetical protein
MSSPARWCALVAMCLSARAEAAAPPLRLFIDCQSGGRTRACPSFLRSYVDELGTLAYTSLADAELVLYVNQTEVALEDQLHLRAVSQGEQGLSAYEITYRLDTRLPVEEQREALRPAFWRVLAPFLAQRDPALVEITLADSAEQVDAQAERSSPWQFAVGGQGWVDWSESNTYLSLSSSISMGYLTVKERMGLSAYGSWDINRQPPLEIDGQTYSLDTDTWDVSGGGYYARNLGPWWSVGVTAGASADDPEGRYALTVGGEAGVSRDFFKADDPRGNELSITYLVGVQCDWYRRVNVLGEEQVCFPTQRLSVYGSIQFDRVELWAYLSAAMQLDRPAARYEVALGPTLSVQVGRNLDLDFGVDLTQQAVPGPAGVDTSNFEEVTRANYANPLELSGQVGFRVHFDRTNGARNGRFESGWWSRF